MKTNSPISPRPELEHFEMYRPGLSIQQIQRQFGLKKVVKLASNESALGPTPKGIAAYKKVGKELFRYPESRSIDLRRAIADRFKRDQGEVIVGNGSDEIIELLAKAYLTPKDEIIVSASAFLQYRNAAQLMGAGIVTIPLRGWKCDLDAMAAAVTPRTKLIFIANPNNPTGTYNTIDDVTRLLRALPGHVLPVFDEAYFEYAAGNPDYPSMVPEFFNRRPIVVLRTFSKIYGLAGLRIGYGIAPETCIRELDKIRPPFNVSIPSQSAGVAALSDERHVRKSVELNNKQRAVVTAALEAMGFEVVPSATNFVLFKAEGHSGRTLFEALLHRGIIARSVDEYGLPDFLRVTIGKADENKFFLEALREVVKKP